MLRASNSSSLSVRSRKPLLLGARSNAAILVASRTGSRSAAA